MGSTNNSQPSLTLDELKKLVELGEIDTVVVVMTDMQGRLVGKRIHGSFFIDEIAHHGTEGCNYLLAVDVDMNTVPGYSMSSWDKGYADFALIPDFNTLRRITWQPGDVIKYNSSTQVWENVPADDIPAHASTHIPGVYRDWEPLSVVLLSEQG